MLEISKEMKLYKFDDGESHYILAKNKEDAKNYYYGNLYDGEIGEDVEIHLFGKDESFNVGNLEEDEILYKMVNKYRAEKDHVKVLPVWTLVKYELLLNEVQGISNELPTLIASTVY